MLSFRRIGNRVSRASLLLPSQHVPPQTLLPANHHRRVRARHRGVARVFPRGDGQILESYGLSVSDLTATGDAVKEDRPGSPRSVLGGAPSASASPDRGTLDLGSFGLGGGAYTLDTGRGLQLSPRGFSRQILFVFADTASRDRCARTLSACDMKCETAVAHGVTTRSTGKAITRILLAPVHVVSRVLSIRLFRIGGAGKAASEETNSADSAWQEAERVALALVVERVALALVVLRVHFFQLAVKRKKKVHEEAAELAARREKEEAAARRKKAAKRKEEAKRKVEAGDKVIRDVKKILKTNRKAIDAVTKAYLCAEPVNEPKLDPKLPHVARFVKLAASKVFGDSARLPRNFRLQRGSHHGWWLLPQDAYLTSRSVLQRQPQNLLYLRSSETLLGGQRQHPSRRTRPRVLPWRP